MATSSRMDTAAEPMRILLRDVPWAAYKALRDVSANDRARMTYLDGTLELMSPGYLHGQGAERIGMLIRAVARASDVAYQSSRSTTFRRRRRGPLRGHGREADASFYLGENAQRLATKKTIDLRVDPPPDLAIEVDNTARSEWKLPVYARLRVPEVWRYDVDARTLWFGRLRPVRIYEPIERSVGLPLLSRHWVLDVLTRGEGLTDSRYEALLEGWVRDELIPPAA